MYNIPMLHWLIQNKEWVFSGAGLTILAIIGWVFRKLWSSKREPPAQPPNITVSPTFHLSQETRTPETPKPIVISPPALPVAVSNLQDEAIKIGKIALQEDVWTISPDAHENHLSCRALLADISNVPLESGNITTVKVKAAIKIEYGGRTRTYSPLPWLEEVTNTVRIAPAARKAVVLAVSRDSSGAPWHFVLNHREIYSYSTLRTPSAMDWTNILPIQSNLPFEIQLVDAENGTLLARFKYLWGFDETLNRPYLKMLPSLTKN